MCDSQPRAKCSIIFHSKLIKSSRLHHVDFARSWLCRCAPQKFSTKSKLKSQIEFVDGLKTILLMPHTRTPSILLILSINNYTHFCRMNNEYSIPRPANKIQERKKKNRLLSSTSGMCAFNNMQRSVWMVCFIINICVCFKHPTEFFGKIQMKILNRAISLIVRQTVE